MVVHTVCVELLRRRQNAVGTTTVASTCTLTVALRWGGGLLRRESEAEPRHRVQPVEALRLKREYRRVRRVRRRNRRVRGESAAAGDRGDAGAVAGSGRFGARGSPYALAVALAEQDYRRPRHSRCLSERRCSSALYQFYYFDSLMHNLGQYTVLFISFF